MTIARSVARPLARPVASSVVSASGASGGSVPPTAILNVAFGESNSGGYADNTDAQSWEIGSRAELQMWNVNTNVFENLDIGTNNNLDHAGLGSSTHGWELGLANRVRQGYFGDLDAYYLQTGQGASTIAQWSVGNASGYWTKFLSRTNEAKTALGSTNYATYVWLSLGINDALAGTPLSNAKYKAGIEELISRIKVQLPSAKFLLFGLPPVNATYTDYSTQLSDIATADSDCTYIAATTPVAVDMKDTNHWSYKGMKRLAARGVDQICTGLSLAGKGLAWSAAEDANYLYFSAANQHSHVNDTIDVATDGYIACELGYSAVNEALVLALDGDVSEVNWGGSDSYYGGTYVYGGNVQVTNANGSSSNTAIGSPIWGRIKWTASNGNVTIDTSSDGGSTWTTRQTYAGAVSGQSTARVKAFSVVDAAFMDVWKS